MVAISTDTISVHFADCLQNATILIAYMECLVYESCIFGMPGIRIVYIWKVWYTNRVYLECLVYESCIFGMPGIRILIFGMSGIRIVYICRVVFIDVTVNTSTFMRVHTTIDRER